MRSLTLKACVIAALMTIAGASQARAALANTVQFTTTFPFTVGKADVPAGTYTVRPLENGARALELTRSRGGVGVFFIVNDIESRDPAKQTEVVFRHYRDGYVLKDIRVEGDTAGVEAVPTREEKHREARHETGAELRVAATRVMQNVKQVGE
jgi:hypothetical protein